MSRRLRYFVVDAFTSRLFAGNPAGVCLVDEVVSDALMQAIATENNLSETAFVRRLDDAGRYRIRWFTPTVEVKLCGHATLASGYALLTQVETGRDRIVFESASGELKVHKDADRFALDFPLHEPAECEPPTGLAEAMGTTPSRVLRSQEYVLAVFDDERTVRGLAPDFKRLREVNATGIIATATGEACDFVSRFFAPRAGINEDPVTGSAHCSLTPYWAGVLGKPRLIAHQVSKRGGELLCEQRGDRVRIGGHATLYLAGDIRIPGA